MEVKRTVKLKLCFPKEEAAHFVRVYTDLCNYASRVAFSLPSPSFKNINRLCYREALSLFGLPSQLTQSAFRAVAGKYAALRKEKKTPKKPVKFQREPVQLQGGPRSRDFRFTKEGKVSLSTIGGRRQVAFSAPSFLAAYRKHGRMGGARFWVGQTGKVFLAVSYSLTLEPLSPSFGKIIAADRGLLNLAVASDGKSARFFGGGKVLQKRKELRNQRAALESRKARRPTRTVRRALKRLCGRESRFMTDINHKISRRLIRYAQEVGAFVLVLEDLSGIRARGRRSKKFRTEVNAWAYYQLQCFLEYKAAQAGILVEYVDPAYSSQECSKCGHTERKNRKGLHFVCQSCLYRLHADLNASRTLVSRSAFSRHVPCQGGAPSIAPKARVLPGKPSH